MLDFYTSRGEGDSSASPRNESRQSGMNEESPTSN